MASVDVCVIIEAMEAKRSAKESEEKLAKGRKTVVD